MRIYDLGADLVGRGVPVQELQRLPLLSRARRIKSLYTSDQLAEIKAFRNEVEKTLEELRLEYAKQEEQA